MAPLSGGVALWPFRERLRYLDLVCERESIRFACLRLQGGSRSTDLGKSHKPLRQSSAFERWLGEEGLPGPLPTCAPPRICPRLLSLGHFPEHMRSIKTPMEAALELFQEAKLAEACLCGDRVHHRAPCGRPGTHPSSPPSWWTPGTRRREGKIKVSPWGP